jgi:hypothetical protein
VRDFARLDEVTDRLLDWHRPRAGAPLAARPLTASPLAASPLADVR